MRVSEKLKRIGVYNTHGLLVRFGVPGKTDVACVFQGRTRWTGRCTQVYSPSHETDPGGPWYQRGIKTFLGARCSPGVSSMLDAREWATQKYGVKEWDVCPTDRNALVPKEVRVAALKAAREER